MDSRIFWPTIIVASAVCTSAGSVTLPPTKSDFDLGHAKVFANLCVDHETKDIDGLRVFVRPPGAKPRVLIQYAEGGLLDPVVAESRPVPGGLTVEVPGDVPAATFSGRVVGDHAEFRSHDRAAQPIHLKRSRDPRYAPYCSRRNDR